MENEMAIASDPKASMMLAAPNYFRARREPCHIADLSYRN